MNKLAQWLQQNGIRRSDFAALVDVSPSYVTLLCSGSAVWPGRDVAARIREATNGAVTADDFLPQPAEPAE